MAYTVHHSIQLPVSGSSAVATYDVYTVSLNRTNHIVKHMYTTYSRSKEDCINNPPVVSGYQMVAAINGGPFGSSGVIESLQIKNSSGVLVEKSIEANHGCGVLGVGIVNGKLKPTYIYGENSSDLSSPEILRGGYRFAILRNGDNSMSMQLPPSSWTNLYNNANTLINTPNRRMGIGFIGNNAYFVYVDENITGNVLMNLIDELGYDKYVNLDGGLSSLLYADGITRKPVGTRGLFDCFYLMKKI